jgi:hypothetical protein
VAFQSRLRRFTHEIPLAAEAQGDEVVDLNDLAILLSHFGGAGDGDLDGNGAVDLNDLALLLSRFGALCP